MDDNVKYFVMGAVFTLSVVKFVAKLLQRLLQGKRKK